MPVVRLRCSKVLIIYVSKRYSCACIIIERMSNSAENTTSTVGTASESKQGGIPLTESAPLSHNPFVHVTLDATERSKQVEQPPARPVSQPMPIWAQQRAFGHMPDKSPRVARTFPQQKNDAGDNIARVGAGAGSSNVGMPISGASASSIARSNNTSGASSASGASSVSRTRKSSDGDSSNSPSDPALRVVLEQKEPEHETESQVVDGVEGKVEIGNDHISVPSDIYAQDELNDLAANMPLIPSNLIFGKGATSSSQQPAPPFNRMSAPARSNFASSPMETGRMGVVWPQNGLNPMGSAPNPYLQGNPRNAMASHAGVGASAAMGSATFGAQMASANPSFADSMQGSGIAGAALGASAINSMSSMPASVPSIPSVPPSTDYRPYAAGGLGAAYNPLHPNPSAMFAAESSQAPAWSAQSGMATRLSGVSAPYSDSAFTPAIRTSSPSMSQPLGSAGRADLYNSQPLDRMQRADSRNLQSSSAFSPTDSRVEKTLPSGMPVSFDSQPSSMHGSAQMRSVPAFGDAGRSAISDLPSPASAPSSAFPSNGDRGVPLDAGTPIPRDSFSKPIGAGVSKSVDVEKDSLFDQPPVPITEGMKSADTSHKKLRRLVMIILIVIVLALGGIVGYLIYSGTVNPSQLVPHITIEAPSDGSSANDSSSQNGDGSSSSSSSDSASSSDGAAGSVVYQYTALTRDRTAYTVEETATFSDDGYCQFTTMKMRFPDAEKAKSFTDNLALDYGNTFTLDSLDGANATVTIDNSALRLDREKYEESLRYSVEDLVILKK